MKYRWKYPAPFCRPPNLSYQFHFGLPPTGDLFCDANCEKSQNRTKSLFYKLWFWPFEPKTRAWSAHCFVLLATNLRALITWQRTRFCFPVWPRVAATFCVGGPAQAAARTGPSVTFSIFRKRRVVRVVVGGTVSRRYALAHVVISFGVVANTTEIQIVQIFLEKNTYQRHFSFFEYKIVNFKLIWEETTKTINSLLNLNLLKY